jgi:hypothetical protein
MSCEHDVVIDDIKAGYSVLVDALPGSGKTTVACSIVKTLAGSSMLITYNRSLADTTRAILQPYDCEVYTYHGLASKLSGTMVHDDTMLATMLRSTWKKCTLAIELLIIDEAQDIRPLYMQLVKRFVAEICPSRIQMLVLGDPKQLLYGFYDTSSADIRFLTMVDQLFEREWKRRSLTVSWRSTRSIAAVVNNLLPTRKMLSREVDGPPVVLFVCDIADHAPILVANLVTQSTYTYDDTMVLLPSVNTWSPATDIVDMLSRANVPVYVVRSGNVADSSSRETERTRKGRVRIHTYHASKGLESPFVIIVNNRGLDALTENATYVALTRAKQELVIIQHFSHITRAELDMLAANTPGKHLRIVIYQDPVSAIIPRAIREFRTVAATEVFSFMDIVHLETMLRLITTEIIRESLFDDDELQSYLDTTIVSFDDDLTFVNVGNICGGTSLLMAEYAKTGSIVRRYTRHHPKLSLLYTASHALLQTNTLQALTMMALYQDACASGYVDRLYDIKQYTFTDTVHVHDRSTALSDAVDLNMKWHVTGRTKYEKTFVQTYFTACNKVECVHVIYKPSIGKEDILTACLLVALSDHLRTCRLVNTYTGQIMRIQCTDAALFVRMALTIQSATEAMCDAAFIRTWT